MADVPTAPETAHEDPADSRDEAWRPARRAALRELEDSLALLEAQAEELSRRLAAELCADDPERWN